MPSTLQVRLLVTPITSVSQSGRADCCHLLAPTFISTDHTNLKFNCEFAGQVALKLDSTPFVNTISVFVLIFASLSSIFALKNTANSSVYLKMYLKCANFPISIPCISCYRLLRFNVRGLRLKLRRQLLKPGSMG